MLCACNRVVNNNIAISEILLKGSVGGNDCTRCRCILSIQTITCKTQREIVNYAVTNAESRCGLTYNESIYHKFYSEILLSPVKNE